MPKATKAYSASRRGLLGGIAAAAVAAPVAACSQDAELLRIVARIEAVQKQSATLWAPYMNVVAGPPKAVMEQSVLLTQEYRSLIAEAGHIRAKTPEGMRAKARAAMTKFSLNRDLGVNDDEDEFIWWSLCCDLLDGAA